jgi:hypothetical protein
MLIKKVCSCRPSSYHTFSFKLGGKNKFMLGSHTLSQAVAVRKHLERNRKDKDSKFRLILIESRIHRLSRYYKSVSVLPPNWRYESATASTMVA